MSFVIGKTGASNPRDSSGTSGLSLPDLFALTTTIVSNPSASQSKLLEQLKRLQERLATERFQLAVLGQFKRGKSTLLNALLRTDVLPTGVIPVTAISAFIQAAPSCGLRVTYASGSVDEPKIETPAMLRERLTALVTEERNPHNRLGIARVDVLLPSELLDRGVVLIDTPGVGSTFRHNTAAADAVLPECDATLFVVSADPPITEIEIEFLARIRKTVARLIIVLNKVDTLEPSERETATAFLRRVLSEQANVDGETPIFCVSARRALGAKETGDAEQFRASGLAELEAHLTQFLATEKSATLQAAIARKAAALVGELQLESEISLKSLRLPVEDLEQRLRTFDEAARGFEVERRSAADLLAGDRVRVLQELETEAERLRAKCRAVLEHELDQALAVDHNLDETRARLTEKSSAFFDEALGDVVREMRERLASLFTVHQNRADELIRLVRQTAANLLEVSFRAPASSDAFEPRRDPFWVTTARNVTLSPIPPGLFDHLLPGPLHKKRMRRRLLEECESVLLRNVENLRWATLQNMEDAFRRFGAELDERLAMSLEATHGAMKAALDRRRQHSEAIEADLVERQASSMKLQKIAADLVRFQ